MFVCVCVFSCSLLGMYMLKFVGKLKRKEIWQFIKYYVSGTFLQATSYSPFSKHILVCHFTLVMLKWL